MATDDQTWLKLWRKSLKSWVYKRGPRMWYLWTTLLMEAAWTTKWAAVQAGRGHATIELQPGQLVFGRNRWAEKLKCNPSTLRSDIAELAEHGNITCKPTNNFTVVSICEWPTYQGDNSTTMPAECQPSDSKQASRVTAECQPPMLNGVSYQGENDGVLPIEGGKNDSKNTTIPQQKEHETDNPMPAECQRSDSGVTAECQPNDTVKERVEVKKVKKVKKKHTHDLSDDEREQLFERFWELYPCRNGRKLNRAEAKTAYMALKPADRDAVMGAVANYAAYIRQSDGKAKDAFRWLRRPPKGAGQEPWRDYIEAPSEPQGPKKGADNAIVVGDRRYR